MAIYLIRHGQSTANAARATGEVWESVYQNVQLWDAPLTQVGMNQAREASEQFASFDSCEGGEMSSKLANPDIILVSTLRRALQTATIVFDNLRNSPETTWIASDVVREATSVDMDALDQTWRALNHKQMCNCRSSLAESKAREEFPHISFEEPHCSDKDMFPEFESVAQLDERCEEFLRLIRRMQKEERMVDGRQPRIAVVAHGLFFRRLLETYKCDGEEVHVKNCQILALRAEDFKEV